MAETIVRRVIPANNSCLFNAIGYAMHNTRNEAPRLRQIVAETVANEPIIFSAAVLKKSNLEYCAWILNPEALGGSIELFILAEHYRREIAVYELRNRTSCTVYNGRRSYTERVMLIYDALHFDALALSPLEGAPEEYDQTIFPTTVGNLEHIGRLALVLTWNEGRDRNYTAADFTHKCGVCGLGMVGQQGATEHARITGHVSLQALDD